MSDSQLTAIETERLREAFARVAYAQLLGIKLEETTRGRATLSLEWRAELSRMEGIMHGGAIASLIDTASAFAVLSLLELPERTVTVDLTLHFLRPVSNGRIEARARVLRSGRRLATVSVEVSNEAGLLIATALTTYIKISE